ncbi:MAG: hypothetical protein ACHQ49_02050 [Elusimicrobiota bacterium]
MSAFLRARLLAAALLSLGSPLLAGPTAVPHIDADVGSGQSLAPLAPAVVPTALSPVIAAPGLLGAGPVAAPVPFQSVFPAAPAAAAAPVAAASPASAPRAVSEELTRSLEGAGGEQAAEASSGAGERESMRAEALFDLAASREDDSMAVPPSRPLRDSLVRLRAAGERGLPGPGSIPGIARVSWVDSSAHGYSGESAKVAIAGQVWHLKRLGHSPDKEIDATPRETRARNEVGLAAVLRADPQLSGSFRVAPLVSVFRDGRDVFVLSEGLPSIGDGESRRRPLSPAQRADASIIQLVLGLGDMHGGDVLPLAEGEFGLVDFEKLSRAPLSMATPHEIDTQVMLKDFPLVDRHSDNDAEVYRARFDRWKRDYQDGGRERMDRALAAQGWSRGARAAYLAAVDRNLETYLERLAPYLKYANDWHRRIEASRAEAARKAAAPKKKFLGGLFGGASR